MNCVEDAGRLCLGRGPMARSASTPTRPSSPPSTMFFAASFAQTGSARPRLARVRRNGSHRLQMHQGAEIRSVEASYTAIHHVSPTPYAGAYAHGKTRRETMLDAAGVRKKACPETASLRVAGAHSGPSSGLHRLADL